MAHRDRRSNRAAHGTTMVRPRGGRVCRTAWGCPRRRRGRCQAAAASASLLIVGRRTIQHLHEPLPKTGRRADGPPLSAGVLTALMLATFTVAIGYV